MVCRRYPLFREEYVRLVMIIAALMAAICILAGLCSLSGTKSEASDEMSYKYYTSVEIKNGDTLWDIASEYMTDEYGSLQEYVAEVKELNNLPSDNIRSGQSIVIPYYATEME